MKDRTKPWCCFIPCDEDAEFNIWGGSGLEHDNSQACTAHVGDLLSSPIGIDNTRWDIHVIVREEVM